MASHSDTILSTVEAFLDTAPDMEGRTIQVSARQTGEAESVRMMEVTIDDERYLVVAKRIGG